MQTSNNCCGADDAEKIAINNYEKRNRSGYKIKVNNIDQDTLHYFVEIIIDEEMHQKVIGNDTLITIIGGGAKYTIDKRTCKIAKVKDYE